VGLWAEILSVVTTSNELHCISLRHLHRKKTERERQRERERETERKIERDQQIGAERLAEVFLFTSSVCFVCVYVAVRSLVVLCGWNLFSFFIAN